MSIAVKAIEPRLLSVQVSEDEINAFLVDGRTISVPIAWSWRLSEATPEQRLNFEIIGDGIGIHWPDIDEDISVEGMLYGSPARRRSVFHNQEDDMIISAGNLLSPLEIEAAVVRNPKVRAAAVVGIPDEILGQKIVAMVELETGNTPSQELAKEIINSTTDLLAKYKLPREVVFLESIPRTPTGKMIKEEMRKHYQDYRNLDVA